MTNPDRDNLPVSSTSGETQVHLIADSVQVSGDVSQKICPETTVESNQNGFAKVGRMLRSRTTDLLAISIIIVAGLTLGDQVVEWWQVDPEEAPSPTELSRSIVGSSSIWGISGEPVGIEFGDSRYQLQRTLFQGDQEAATKELIEQCREFVTSDLVLPETTDVVEQRLLHRLKRGRPVERDDAGNWRIDRIDGPLTQFVATRPVPSKDNDDSTSQSTENSSRVVCWGMVFPSVETGWLLYTFHVSDQTGVSVGELPKFELPAGSRQIMSLRTETGGALITFEGEGDSEQWQRFFDKWFHEKAGETLSGWKQLENSRHVKYQLHREKSLATIDIVFYRNQDGLLIGTINVLILKQD